MITSLNIGQVPPTRRPQIAKVGPCPQCGASPDARVKEGAFGTRATQTLCGHCGHEFKEQA